MSEDGVGAVTARAVTLYALGQYERALVTLQGVMAERVDGFTAATGLAQVILADPAPPHAWEITGLSERRHRQAVPVAGALVSMTRHQNYGAMHAMWDRLPGAVAGDVIAVLLAMAGTSICHPELN